TNPSKLNHFGEEILAGVSLGSGVSGKSGRVVTTFSSAAKRRRFLSYDVSSGEEAFLFLLLHRLLLFLLLLLLLLFSLTSLLFPLPPRTWFSPFSTLLAPAPETDPPATGLGAIGRKRSIIRPTLDIS
ncbi:hypothetical protein TorRG33x02_189840, partial [Trema orientale]